MQKKAIIFVVLFLFVIGGSVSAGNSVQPLTDWHHQEFRSISENLGSATATGLFKVYKTTNQFVANTKERFDHVLERLTGAEEKALRDAMTQYEQALNDDLTKTENKLTQRNFNNYKEQQTNEQMITDEVNELLAEILERN